MLQLSRQGITDRTGYETAGIKLPEFDVDQAVKATVDDPMWVHFGAGNIFRGFIAAAQQKVMDQGACRRGIIAVESFDYSVIDRVYEPYDNLSLLALLGHDGSVKKEVIASVCESIKGDSCNAKAWARLKEIFRHPGLQMISFTITEKGYALADLEGRCFPIIENEIKNGPTKPVHTMAVLTALLYERYLAGKLKLAVVSLDNCAQNGKKLFDSVMAIAEGWQQKGHVEKAFLDYLQNESLVAFPWTMIDKITPHPSETVKKLLEADGLAGMEIVETSTKTLTAPFVNAEEKEYLVVEDSFPSGRPPLEKAGILFCDRETVDRVEQMKVGTCLNPLHTALAIFGCLLGYTSIASEMQDRELKTLIEAIVEKESMKVVVDPGIISPEQFAREVMEFRFPNPFIPDTPQRIAADTSQKIPVRFGKTVKAYVEREELDPSTLHYIPLVFAGWLRYLLAVDDAGEAMTLSPDPMLDTLQNQMKGLALGSTEGAAETLRPILENSQIFGADLHAAGLAEKVLQAFEEMSQAAGCVRATLVKYLNTEEDRA